MDEEIENFLSKNEAYFDVLQNGQILCKVTNHEMKPSLEILKQHLAGRKFRSQRRFFGLPDGWYEKYAPYVVPDKYGPKMYCSITGYTLNKDPIEVEKHMKGALFQRKLEIVKHKQEERRRIEERAKKKRQEAKRRAQLEENGATANKSSNKQEKKHSIQEPKQHATQDKDSAQQERKKKEA